MNPKKELLWSPWVTYYLSNWGPRACLETEWPIRFIELRSMPWILVSMHGLGFRVLGAMGSVTMSVDA